MGFWSEYDVRADVVYDEWDDAINSKLGNTPATGGGGGGAPPDKPEPQGQPPPPAGFKVVPETNRVVNTAGTVSMSWNGATGQWDRSPYPPSADDKRAAGAGTGSTSTGGTTYTRTPYGPNQLADIEGRTIPRRGSQESRVDPKTGEVFTRGGDGTWRGGYFANPRDVQQDIAATRAAGGALPGQQAAPGQPQGIVSPYAGLAGTLGTLRPDQTPQLPTFANATVAGYGVPTEGRQYMYTGSGLNMLTAQPRSNSGIGGGPVVEPRPFQARQAGLTDRQFIFNQGRPGQQVLAQKEFASVPISVPIGYMPGRSGFSQTENGGSFRAFDIPINAGPEGTGLIQLTGPTTMTVGNTGYLTSGMAYNDPLAVYGRQGSNDAATRAAQVAQVVDERNALLERGYSPSQVIDLLTATKDEENDVAAGEGILRGYATGTRGGIATAPLGRPDQVTNEPIIAIGMMTGKPHFIAGEDNADADSMPNAEMIHITPMRGYAEGTTGGITTAAPSAVTTTPALPTATKMPVIDTGPEIQTALRTARIQQQQQGQQLLRSRAGLGGTTAIRTNRKIEGLAPGYYTLPADYSSEIGAAQTELAGIGPVLSDPSSALTYRNQIAQQLAPLKQAQDIETELLGLGTLGDPAQLEGEAARVRTLIEPLRNAQSIEQKIAGMGTVRDPALVQTERQALRDQYGPVTEVFDARAKLLALGNAFPGADIQQQTMVIQGYEDAIRQANEMLEQINQFPNSYGPGTATYYMAQMQEAQQNMALARNQLSQMLQHNNAINDQLNIVNNLAAAYGITSAEHLAQLMGTYQAQNDALEQEYNSGMQRAALVAELNNIVPEGTDINALLGKYGTELAGYQQGIENTQRAAQLRTSLANYVPEGTNVSARIGELTGLSDAAQRLYEQAGRASDLERTIQSYRDSTDIQGITQDEAPPQVIQQAVVTTPALKAIAQSDPASANAIARLDYALSQDAWTPASSQALVNLTNSLQGSKAKDSVQAMLQGLVSRMTGARGVPPALAAAAQTNDPAKMAAAVKFGQAA